MQVERRLFKQSGWGGNGQGATVGWAAEIRWVASASLASHRLLLLTPQIWTVPFFLTLPRLRQVTAAKIGLQCHLRLCLCVWACRYAFGITLWEIFTAARPYQVRFWSYRMLPLQKSKHTTTWFYSGQPCQPACELIACRICSLHAGRYASPAGAPCLTTARTSSLPSRHATGLCLLG